MSEDRTTAQPRDAARAWQLMAHFVIDHRGPWRKAMMARTGLPFNHFRLLRRIGSGAVTIGDLAAAATIDAPAATVGVNELEKRGLAERTVDPTNRRRKLVSLTDSGRAVLADAMTTDDPAPSAFDALDDDEIAELVRLIAKLDTTAHG
ncbi:MarR family winged helix-turn-helix transcriptional regulator [Williamsia phyllosphaerae]|uniref:Transcription regulator protein, MarR n=1 Tax=Williamsia phyllosphaerae TaxID=885042 RepID=A0ABQ1U588_9NOCA|nr:MarR family winged helix-turn-helix transcriptional regulator [Williamsia phyllosphaerae]GGF10327.1 putative transcription regulator protein, MarR [Williamsia phyllosphaerae]